MKTITGNEFFQTLRGAMSAGSRRGYNDGARIIETDEGFCLLQLTEGCGGTQSQSLIQRGSECVTMRGGKWSRDWTSAPDSNRIY